jgi:hypothetical protein
VAGPVVCGPLQLQRNAALAMVLDPENKIMKKIKRAVTAEVKSTGKRIFLDINKYIFLF